MAIIENSPFVTWQLGIERRLDTLEDAAAAHTAVPVRVPTEYPGVAVDPARDRDAIIIAKLTELIFFNDLPDDVRDRARIIRDILK